MKFARITLLRYVRQFAINIAFDVSMALAFETFVPLPRRQTMTFEKRQTALQVARRRRLQCSWSSHGSRDCVFPSRNLPHFSLGCCIQPEDPRIISSSVSSFMLMRCTSHFRLGILPKAAITSVGFSNDPELFRGTLQIDRPSTRRFFLPRPFHILGWRLDRLQSNELLLFSRLHRVCRALEKRDEFRDNFQSPLAAIDEISQITVINDQSAAAFLPRNVPKTRGAQRTFQTSHRASHR